MRVLFLDFDGVLNSEASFRLEKRRSTQDISNTLSELACANLQYVLDQAPDLKLVISSTWRLLHDIDYLRMKLVQYGVDASRVVGITPATLGRDRGHELKLWLAEYPEVLQFVVVDDDRDAHVFDEDPRCLMIRTTWTDGLLLAHAEQIIRFLQL